jgi:uncharacterized protein (DUF1697 family)
MPRVATLVALLRGVNVGGRARLPMAELRSLFESLGHTGVTTYIQSGNVLFSARGRVPAASLEAAIAAAFGIETKVVLRTPAELARVLERNPFPAADTALLLVGFLARRPAAAAVAKLERERYLPEEFALAGSDLYVHLPQGLGNARLLPYLDRRLGVAMTVRNWRTVAKLAELGTA